MGSSAPSASLQTTPSCVVLVGQHSGRKGCHPEGPGQDWEAGRCQPCEVQQGQTQRPAHGLGQSQEQIQAGWRVDWAQPSEEGLGDAGWQETRHDLAMCACSPEGQPHPGLHPQQRGQQVEGGDSASFLCSGETPTGVLHPALEASAQERHRAVGVGPDEATKMLEGREHLSCEKRLKGFSVWRSESSREILLKSSSTLKGLQESWKWTFYKGMEWQDKG